MSLFNSSYFANTGANKRKKPQGEGTGKKTRPNPTSTGTQSAAVSKKPSITRLDRLREQQQAAMRDLRDSDTLEEWEQKADKYAPTVLNGMEALIQEKFFPGQAADTPDALKKPSDGVETTEAAGETTVSYTHLRAHET